MKRHSKQKHEKSDSKLKTQSRDESLRPDDDGVIRFTRADLNYGFLSNLHEAPFEHDGRTWPSVEHCFQANKFAGTEYERKICLEKDPVLARELGMRPEQQPGDDWESNKERVMHDALRAKFTHHPDLRKKLLATGDTPLVDHEGDKYWGDNGDGTGRNRMGIILMEVRDELRQQYPDDSPQIAPADRDRKDRR